VFLGLLFDLGSDGGGRAAAVADARFAACRIILDG
jgi:hypothetical protein